MKHLFLRTYNLYTCILVLSVLWFTPLTPIHAKQGFAIVIDSKSYAEAQTEVNQYAEVLEQKQHFKVYIVQDIWHTPHGIKAELERLYNRKKDAIVGAVFIGDIPIAMIRHAQRLTSAFKRNEDSDWKTSSVPSDRYYEDFQMDFRFLQKDNTLPYFYYALSPSSTQHLQCNIFSGRIKPTNYNNIDKYEHLRRYLRKVIAYKLNEKTINQMLFFTGHGYISDSFVARMHETNVLYEHFPTLKHPNNTLFYLDYRFQNNTKTTLMNALQSPTIDIALLHHHGAPDTQYLDATLPASTAEEAQQLIQAYGREYVRKQVNKNQNKDSVLQKLSQRFNVSDAWFNNAFEEKIKQKDSLNNANKDLTLADFSCYNFRPNAKMVILDACFNGSFHLDSCIASAYIFNAGNIIACIANSVNVLQDKWSDRYLGLMQQGLYAGNIASLSELLESHCIGDPTFCFKNTQLRLQVNRIVNEKRLKMLRKYLSPNQPADVSCLAMDKLFKLKALSSKQLFHFFTHSSTTILRLQALSLLAHSRDSFFIKAIKCGVNDANEYIQRTSLNLLTKNGSETLLPVLITKMLEPTLSPRCAFSITNALSLYKKEQLMHTLDSVFSLKSPYMVCSEQVYKKAKAQIINNSSKWWGDINTIINEKESIKKRLKSIRSTRTYCPYSAIPLLVNCAKSTTNDTIKRAIIESLGWRYHSVYLPLIRSFLQETRKNNKFSTEIREEAEQSERALCAP